MSIDSPIVIAPRKPGLSLAPALMLLCLLAMVAGCKRFHPDHHETVYVWARQMYLRDRVAAVSNRVAQVENGQQLDVLEHGRRFLKVKTQKNEIGWIEERAVIDQKAYQVFADLGSAHKADPVVATGVVRDDVYLHVKPGRETDRFYLLAANAKVELLMRASVVKAQAGMPVAVKPAAKPATTASGQPDAPDAEAPPPPMEDWWLIRDGQGRTGWLLSGRIDIDVPDEIGIYAEGQRIVGAYVLNKIADPESANPDHLVPQYVTILSPPKSGLPFDFDQIRVFTWDTRRHRYETAFRLHPIQGFLPFVVTQAGAGAPQPGFSFHLASDPSLVTDPDTGVTRPAHPRTINYQITGIRVQRVGPDLGPIPVSHLPESQPKGAKGGKGNNGAKPAKGKKR